MSPTPAFLHDGPAGAGDLILLAHGAGAPMDSPFMAAFAEGLARHGAEVVRFEFPYMAQRRHGGGRRPPDRAPVLLEFWRQVVERFPDRQPVLVGKSLGGRMASLIADEVCARGLVCLGYPFHPPGRPETLRTDHLAGLKTSSLIVQGSRDALGSCEEVAGYALAPSISLHWAEDGDHSLKPRRKSGRTEAQNWAEAIAAVAAFLARLPAAPA